MSLPLIHSRVPGSGITLHSVSCGEGPQVVLLHGFPECWYSWHHQLQALAAAGFRVTALDLRGYNLSDKPGGVSQYHVNYLVDDIAEVIRNTGTNERAHIVGHDWGGILAWIFASRYPQLTNKLVIMNAPHPGVYREQLWRSTQAFRSWYVLLFTLPQVAEWKLSANNYAAIRKMFKKMPVKENAFSDQDVDVLIGAISQPGALTAALNYYRCGVLDRSGMNMARYARTEAPTLIIWGEKDTALGIELLNGNEQFAPNLQIHRIPEAGHWVQNEAPEEVNAVLSSFLGADSSNPQSNVQSSGNNDGG